MKKIISFSLYNGLRAKRSQADLEKYTFGAIRNAELALEVYPGWICRYYIGEDIDKDIIEDLMSFDNTEICMVAESGHHALGTFWRFHAASDPEVDILISRDTDSRLNMREKLAVDEWLASDKDFHIMRDHNDHNVPILSGMWGVRNGLLSNMSNNVNAYPQHDVWQVDQNFLREIVYPFVRTNAIVHDEFFHDVYSVGIAKECIRPFNSERDPNHFVGQAYGGDDRILDKDEFFIDRLLEENDEKLNPEHSEM